MAEGALNSSPNVISFRDLTDRLDIVIDGVGNYIIGLSADGSILIEQNDFNLCMSLLYLIFHENGGCTLSSANNDLPCYLNNSVQPLSGEVHLIDGSTIEMADKKLKFFNGPIPKRRRKLPPTPGTVVGEPPTKPSRRSVPTETETLNTSTETAETKHDASEDIDDVIPDHNADVEADQRWLEASWCMLDLPESDQYMFKDLYTPEQISILAASYFTKQLRMFTDAIITQHLLDSIFRLFMDTISHCRDTYMEYLADISRALGKIPDRSNTRPMHGPAVKFLTELLKQCLDPVDRVVLILDLLRTFSHFDNNLDRMVRWQTTASVLGSMSAYASTLEVQRYGIDILAKVATFKPTIEKKTPVREVAVDLIARAVQYHASDLQLARSSCRVLANLSSTLITVLNQTLESVSPTTDKELCGFINKYEELLNYIFKDGIPLVQALMRTFVSDIGVNTEGRRFIFYYVKLPQMQLKKTRWMTEASQTLERDEEMLNAEDELNASGDQDKDAMDTEPESSKLDSDPECHEEKTESTSSNDNTDMQLSRDDTRELSKSIGILKKVGSYENLRTPQRRLGFHEGTVGGSDSDTDTFTSVSDAECDGSIMFSLPKQRENEKQFNSNVVKHLVRKTIKRRDTALGNESDDSVESETEHEFLSSLNGASSVSAYDGDLENSCKEIKSEDVPLRKYDYNDLEKSSQHGEISKDTNSPETEGMEAVSESESTVKDEPETMNSQSVSNIEEGRMDEVDTTLNTSVTSDMKHSAITDVVYLGKLVRTQIITYVGSLVFRGEDSMVLMVIDKSIKTLLEDAAAPPGLIEYAGSQYGANMTLMDLEPAIVIGVIDAVRYRSVTTELVQSAVLSLTRSMCATLQKETINTTMLYFKAIFSDPNLRTIITDEEFLKEFRTCFQNATERMERCHTIEEIRSSLGSNSFVV